MHCKEVRTDLLEETSEQRLAGEGVSCQSRSCELRTSTGGSLAKVTWERGTVADNEIRVVLGATTCEACRSLQ